MKRRNFLKLSVGAGALAALPIKVMAEPAISKSASGLSILAKADPGGRLFPELWSEKQLDKFYKAAIDANTKTKARVIIDDQGYRIGDYIQITKVRDYEPFVTGGLIHEKWVIVAVNNGKAEAEFLSYG